MANTIKIKRGLKGSLPTLNVGELAYCTDTEELFIGTSLGNKLLNSGGGAWGTITGNLADQEDLAEMVMATDQAGTSGLPDMSNMVNIQPDWNQTDDTKYDYIKNKPTSLGGGVQPDWNQTDIEADDYIKNKPTNITNVQPDWNQSNNTQYDYIKNKPTIPTIDANTTIQGNTFNGANQLVKLDANGKLPAIDGSALLNVGGGYSNIDGGSPSSIMGGITPIDGGTLPPIQP